MVFFVDEASRAAYGGHCFAADGKKVLFRIGINVISMAGSDGGCGRNEFLIDGKIPALFVVENHKIKDV